ncbi:hypothetical protein [Halobacillus amylolyticus]|uniref:Uncharacterized protein n=1 Tax=Halobacillus amylolyticus TaxID=2932259 RepID=A0ABY4H849_9BACI|nr:hypothetical protein [Halobacillus amylolyticus]UOR10647.1 hypothetical protein MUO15_13380 [Halobacillus amylolyticus]
MDDFDTIISDLELPNELKDFLISSKSIREYINKPLLKDVEDLYIFYKSFYVFDKSEFGAQSIAAIKRCKDQSTFYYYLKKILDSDLEFQSKNSLNKEELNYIKLERGLLNDIIKDSTSIFIHIVNKIYNKEENIDMIQTYKAVGKLELINQIIEDPYYKDLLESGKIVINEATTA